MTRKRNLPHTCSSVQYCPSLQQTAVLLTITCILATTGSSVTDCSGQYVCYIVTDGSESISADSFEIVKQALMNFSSEVMSRNPANRIGIVVFSDDVTEVIQATSDAIALQQQIANVFYPASGTRTDLGIKRGRELLLNDTEPVPKVLVVVTDGVSNLPIKTQEEANITKESGISVFSVGVTQRVKFVVSIFTLYTQELRNMASDEDSTYVLDTFQDLVNNAVSIIRKMCATLIFITSPAQRFIVFVGEASVRFSVNVNQRNVIGRWDLFQPVLTPPPDFTDRSKYLMSTSEFEQAFQIFNIQFSDAGLYRYEVHESSGIGTFIVLERLGNVVGDVNSQARFELRMSTYGGATGTWYRGGVAIQATDSRYIISSIGETQSLIIRNVQLSDAGAYTFRVDGSTVETTGMLTVVVIGQWLQWEKWTVVCLFACGRSFAGFRVRTRVCDSDLNNCAGERQQSQPITCDRGNCPVPGEVIHGEWSAWITYHGNCQATCDPDAFRVDFRNRTCTNPAPRNGGAECQGLSTERIEVKCGLTNACPGTSCFKVCQNGGTFNNQSCSCRCPSGFEGDVCEKQESVGVTAIAAICACVLSVIAIVVALIVCCMKRRNADPVQKNTELNENTDTNDEMQLDEFRNTVRNSYAGLRYDYGVENNYSELGEH